MTTSSSRPEPDHADSAPEPEPTPRPALDWTPDVDWNGDLSSEHAILIDMLGV